HIDLRILLFDLFGQLLKLRSLVGGGLSRRGVGRRRNCLGETVRARESDQDRCGKSIRDQGFHQPSILALAASTGKQGRLKGASLPSYYFSLNFLPCRSACKSRLIPLRGVRSRGTKVVRARPTFRGRTRKICSKKCGRLTPTNPSATASAPVNNGQAASGARSEFFGSERRFSRAPA